MLVVTKLCWRISFRFHCSHTAFYGGIMPLNLADINTDYIIQKICGNEGDRQYLETLGFIEGATVRIVSILLGSYIVRIQESKIGISQDFTKMIIVQA